MVDDALPVVHGGSRSDKIIAGDGGTLLDGQAGDDLLVAGDGGGDDTVRFATGYDADTVQNFDISEDIEVLDFTGLLQRSSEDNGNTVIDFGDGDNLTLEGVELTAANFTVDGVVLPEGLPTIEVPVDTSAAELN